MTAHEPLTAEEMKEAQQERSMSIDAMRRAVEAEIAKIKWLDILDAAIKAPEGWRPIETAPKNESYLLLHVAGYLPTVGRWSIEWEKWLLLEASDLPGDKSYLDYCREFQYAPTHWMPLPDTPPKEGA